MFILLLIQIALLIFVIYLFYKIARNVKKVINVHYSNLSALISIYNHFHFNKIPPSFNKYAMSPTNLQKILNLITTKKPNQIVEFGSGLSTLFIAYCIHGLGQGSIISYDHDKRFAELNNKILLDHGLSNYAKVIYAPLKTMTIHQSKWLWYKPNNDTFPDHIDFLVIDGPPRKTQKLARYPALHAIYNKLSVNATIVLDDSSRKDEKNILKKWQEEFSQLSTIDMEDIENLKVLRMS